MFVMKVEEKPEENIVPVTVLESHAQADAEQVAELRRQMYESIAQGNALAEAEDQASRRWRGR